MRLKGVHLKIYMITIRSLTCLFILHLLCLVPWAETAGLRDVDSFIRGTDYRMSDDVKKRFGFRLRGAQYFVLIHEAEDVEPVYLNETRATQPVFFYRPAITVLRKGKGERKFTVVPFEMDPASRLQWLFIKVGREALPQAKGARNAWRRILNDRELADLTRTPPILTFHHYAPGSGRRRKIRETIMFSYNPGILNTLCLEMDSVRFTRVPEFEVLPTVPLKRIYQSDGYDVVWTYIEHKALPRGSASSDIDLPRNAVYSIAGSAFFEGYGQTRRFLPAKQNCSRTLGRVGNSGKPVRRAMHSHRR